jgi:transposase
LVSWEKRMFWMQALAKYGADRHRMLDLYHENPEKMLQKLVQRRFDLKKMLVQEKNRLQAPDQKDLRKSFEIIIAALEQQLQVVNEAIENYCQAHPHLNEQRKVLETIDGIGKTISVQLLTLLPELGHVDRKKIASLGGLAPHPCESGKKKGHRQTKGGRKGVKEILFMAALAASRSKSELGSFYRNLIARGKKKMVALVALMRKILVIANARLREYHILHSLS